MSRDTPPPKGWDLPSSSVEDRSCVLVKHLEDFKYAEIHYEPDDKWGHDYALYKVDVDGMSYSRNKQGSYQDIGKAVAEGNKL